MCTYINFFSARCYVALIASVKFRIAKFRTALFGQYRTSLKKDSVASYAWIWTLFSASVTGPDALCNALNISHIRL